MKMEMIYLIHIDFLKIIKTPPSIFQGGASEPYERARKKTEGKIKDGKFEYKGKWYNIKDADMGYKIDAVTWWNKKGRFTGAKSPRVRRFMRNPNNYELQPYWINRSNGAKLGETYLPPVIIN